GGVRDHHPRRPGREDQDRRRGHRLHRAGASQEMTRRVVITGMGTVNSLCPDVPGFWAALCAGKSGVDLIEQFDATAFKVKVAGEVKGWDADGYLDGKAARRMDRFAQFALVATLAAVKDSGLEFAREDPYRCGVIVGSGIGGLNEWEEQHARYIHFGPGKVSP